MIERNYTPAEVAEILRISPKTVRNKLHAGEFGATIDINPRKHLITESGLREYIANHTGYPCRPRAVRHTAAIPGRKTGRI